MFHQVALHLPLFRIAMSKTRRCNVMRKLSFLVIGLALGATVAASDTANPKNLAVFNDVDKSVNHYAQFTIFDDVSATVKDGVVTLIGRVTMPYKKSDLEKRIAKLDGVREVHDA